MLCSFSEFSFGQKWIDLETEERWKVRVKQIDELMLRLNTILEEEVSTSEKMQTLVSLMHRSHFDGLDGEGQNQAISFLKDMVAQSPSFMFEDGHWKAAVDLKVNYKGTTEECRLWLVPQKDKQEVFSWGVLAIEAPFLEIPTEDSTQGISPIAHELGFSKLFDVMNKDHKSIAAKLAFEHQFQSLDVWAYLVYHKEIVLEDITNVTFYFEEVSGWVFQVQEIEKQGTDPTGWLINDIIKTN